MHQLKVKPSQQLLQRPRQHLLLRLLSLLHQLAAAAAGAKPTEGSDANSRGPLFWL